MQIHKNIFNANNRIKPEKVFRVHEVKESKLNARKIESKLINIAYCFAVEIFKTIEQHMIVKHFQIVAVYRKYMNH